MQAEPTRCNHPACGQWTFAEYCTDHRAYTPSPPSLRGVGCVTPKPVVRYRKPKHVRRNDGYYASNGAFIATAEAGYLEFAKDVAMTRRASARNATRAEASIVKAHRITAADLAPIGDVDS